MSYLNAGPHSYALHEKNSSIVNVVSNDQLISLSLSYSLSSHATLKVRGEERRIRKKEERNWLDHFHCLQHIFRFWASILVHIQK